MAEEAVKSQTFASPVTPFAVEAVSQKPCPPIPAITAFTSTQLSFAPAAFTIQVAAIVSPQMV
jgi:hypothetical protein